MTITIEAKDIYGHMLYYPVCDKAKLFAQIAGTKTLTEFALDRIRKLGYTIERKAVVEVS